jgi:hypothetical protein
MIVIGPPGRVSPVPGKHKSLDILVDSAGNTKALIGTDGEQDTALVFLDGQNRERAKFGLQHSVSTPTRVMNGEDGKERVVFHLSVDDEIPMILLSDQDGIRVHLGYEPPDFPDPKWDDWGISFQLPHSERSIAAVWMGPDYTNGKLRAHFVAAMNDRVK